MAPRVIFIHGIYLNGQSWQPWTERFASAGFSSDAPSWPYHDGEPRDRRATVDAWLLTLTFEAVCQHYKKLRSSKYQVWSAVMDA